MRQMLLLVLLATGQAVGAQEIDPPPVRTFEPFKSGEPARQVADTPVVAAGHGDVTIQEDERITRLMEDFAKRKHTLKGYRVQIFLGGDRQAGQQVRREFLLKHVDIPAYEDYLAPNFRVRVGDLRTRMEAAKLLRELKADHPGAYVVPDEIEMPRLPE